MIMKDNKGRKSKESATAPALDARGRDSPAGPPAKGSFPVQLALSFVKIMQ
jgi:hypothetical protein